LIRTWVGEEKEIAEEVPKPDKHTQFVCGDGDQPSTTKGGRGKYGH